tara:strand:+ start:230 stop:1489 length:1260 start_codon:yes stop_codon:yes gene_type:complete
MKNTYISIVGLGYVGLPLAVEFSKKFKTIGFDINNQRIEELTNLYDSTDECSRDELKNANNLIYTSNINNLKNCNVHIITVPTPIDRFKSPDLSYLIDASKKIASILKKDDTVIYESTVYPGCTEEQCVPILEQYSGLKYNKDFFCGYSPERINPGDKINRLPNIMKVTSGSNKKTAQFVDFLYNTIIKAGTHLASSIKVAEASKAIENAQRDVNISFINELSIIFEKIGIDTQEVLDAAGTKWNFIKLKPGLVGGHCISVDPYYLAYKSESLGYYPQVILSGRRVNDNMPEFIANNSIKLLLEKNIIVKDSKVLILGITFKENCPDIRNTKVPEVYSSLKSYGLKRVDIYDPHANYDEVKSIYNINLCKKLVKYELIILAVAHDSFKIINLEDLKSTKDSVVYDLKCFFDANKVNKRL